MTSERHRGTVVRYRGLCVIVTVDGTRESVRFYGYRVVPQIGDRLEFVLRGHAFEEPGRLRTAREVRKARE